MISIPIYEMSSYNSETVGVKAALAKMSFTDELKSYIAANQSTWANFGKMTSHLYREKLMKLMDNNNLSPESRFMVFFFFSVIKNQPRVLKSLNDLPSEVKAQAWFNGTRDFIATHVTQYVTATSGNQKFPAVNIPSCNPGLDILVFCLITNPADKTVDNLRNRTTFSQLFLDSEMQSQAKIGYANYWDNIVQGTKNPNSTEEPKMREQYYNTTAGDKYKLIGLNMKEIDTPSTGYTRKIIEDYMRAMV